MNHFVSAGRELAKADEHLKAAQDFAALTQRIIGMQMREAREQKGVSLRHMATLLRYSPPYISDLEKGKRNWTIQLVMKYEKHLA